MLLSAYICRPSTVAAKQPETRTAFVPVLHLKQMWPSSIHFNMWCCCCCCISLHLCGLFSAYLYMPGMKTVFFCNYALQKSSANKQRGSINCGGLAARACLGRVAAVRWGHRWGAGSPSAPHRLQKYNTKEFNPCAFTTKDYDSISPKIPRS